MTDRYLEPTQAAGAALFSRNIPGQVVMLNLLRFLDTADYSAAPDLAPETPISGREAYQRYIDFTLTFLRESGGDILLLGEGGDYFIGPPDERWDVAMLIRQNSLADFMAFASNPDYMVGMAHRTAALADSRLLPLVEYTDHNIIKP